jgi:hypothetical protein
MEASRWNDDGADGEGDETSMKIKRTPPQKEGEKVGRKRGIESQPYNILFIFPF